MKPFYILILNLFLLQSFATEKDSLVFLELTPFKTNKPILFLDDCDACGCATSGGAIGFSSMLNKQFIGVRYFSQHYKTNDGLYANSAWQNENYNTTQIWSKIAISNKIEISTLIPYQSHNRTTTTDTETISGLGDVTLLGMYSVFNKKNENETKNHIVKVGTGLKLPTGSFNESNNGSINPSFQLGTGSWDYLFLAEYTFTKNNWGINNMINYNLKTANKKEYKFGNQLNYNITGYRILKKNDYSFLPQLGVMGEVYDTNEQYKQTIQNTAGSILLAKAGVEIGLKAWSLGLHAMQPLQQNLLNGNVENKFRWSLNLNYAL